MKVGIDSKGLIRKIERIPSLYKTIIVLVIACLLLTALIYFFARPQWETRAKLQKEYAKLSGELNNLKQISRNLDKHRREYQQLQEKLQEVLSQLPETKDVPNLLRNVTSVSEETRLKLIYFEPKEMKQKEFYSELPFDLKFTGSFHSVGAFLDDIRKLDRLISVTNYSLVSKGSGRSIVLEGSCTANAYVYQKEKPAVQKKDGNKAGNKAGNK